MKICLVPLALLSAVLFAQPAAAQVAGPWRVNGKVGDRAFVLDCQFEPHRTDLGGVCVDAATGEGHARGGKAHPLTKGAVAGNQVSWTMQSSFMLAPIDVNFAGALDGDRIAGTISAVGRKGVFAAVRK